MPMASKTKITGPKAERKEKAVSVSDVNTTRLSRIGNLSKEKGVGLRQRPFKVCIG